MQKIIPVYKPPGFSTYDIIRVFKRKTAFGGKIGHGGTLDPFACGVVLLLLGKATKKFLEIKKWEKVYLAGIRLGATSTTQDIEGEIKTRSIQSSTVGAGLPRPSRGVIYHALKDLINQTGAPKIYAVNFGVKIPTLNKIKKILPEFQGTITQKVPAYSAAKHKGKPLYELARQGKRIQKTKKVQIKKIDFIFYKWPLLTIRVTTLGGTYIRQLASDIGERLACGGFLYFLQREKVGQYDLKSCYLVEELGGVLVSEFQ